MTNKPKVRFLVMAVAMVVMMSALIYQLGALTIANGASLSAQAESRSTRSLIIKGTRGRILDRNGVVLAYSETSYNVEFFRDPERRSTNDSALYTESLIKAIRIIEAGGGKTIDTSYIAQDEEGNLVYDWGVQSEAAVKSRYRNYLDAISLTSAADKNPDDMSKWPDAQTVYLYLRKSWQIPEELSFEEANKVISIRQEVLLNNYRAYEPVTIAYDVSMEVVAQIEMHKDELIGLQTAQSTKRIYPRGVTAAHVLGYLSRSADTVPVSTLKAMGYQEADFKEYIQTDEDGNAVVDMTDMGYSYSDMIGVSGIERSMEAYLTGATTDKQGATTIEVNKYGSMIRKLDTTKATDGYDVMLTLDISLQQVTEQALATVIEAIHAKQEAKIAQDQEKYYKASQNRKNGIDSINLAQTGAIVVMDVNSGQVLSMASSPSFDPNAFISGLTEEQAYEFFQSEYAANATPMRNKAISAKSEPGSIFKMVTGLAGLMEGVITLDEQIDCEFKYYPSDEEGNKIESDPVECHTGSLSKSHAKHADQNLSKALTNSCNYYFNTVAERLGITRLNEWAGKLGLTSATNIELPGETVGMVGGQEVLYDNTLPMENQQTSLPRLVYNQLCELLRGYLAQRNMEVDEEAVDKCARHLLELQDGSMDNKGGEVRRILSDDLGIPERISSVYNWTREITSALSELQWKATITIRSGIGQGVSLVTPIAVARYLSAIANGGTVYDAHVVNRIMDGEGATVEVVEPSVYNQIDAPEQYWAAIQRGLEGVVSPEDGGTAAEAFTEGFVSDGYSAKLSGKTGTAQTGISSIDIENTSWFVTYLPKDDPEIAVVVCVPYGLSGSSSAPAVEVIAKYYLDLKAAAAPEDLVAVNGIVP